MNKEQQINSMSLDIVTPILKGMSAQETAEYLHKLGYRKQSDTVREFAEKVEFILSGSFENAKAGFNLYGWSLVGMSYSGEGVGIDKTIKMIKLIAKEYGVENEI